jgi:uncharacterized protein YecT (DUF1311 family)
MRRLPLLIVFVLALSVSAQQPSDAARFKALDKTIEAAPPEQRIAYNALLVAFTTFRDARAGQELCRAVIVCEQQEKSRLNAEFLTRAEVQPTALRASTREDLETEDAALNNAYEQMLALLPEGCGGRGCLSQGMFRDIQRDWIRYRDSWVTFATLRWPQVTPESWQTLLTRDRTTQISQLPRPN